MCPMCLSNNQALFYPISDILIIKIDQFHVIENFLSTVHLSFEFQHFIKIIQHLELLTVDYIANNVSKKISNDYFTWYIWNIKHSNYTIHCVNTLPILSKSLKNERPSTTFSGYLRISRFILNCCCRWPLYVVLTQNLYHLIIKVALLP